MCAYINCITNLFFFSQFFSICLAVLGKIRSAVGSAHLLMSQKFQQFYWLCQQNLVCGISKIPMGYTLMLPLHHKMHQPCTSSVMKDSGCLFDR